jgi:hypothetical protein
MLPKVQVYAIDGFDTAIIGTAYRGGQEVLVYDGYAAEAIIARVAPKAQSLHDYLTSISLQKLGDRAPVFVFLDDDVVGDFDESAREPGTPVH